MNPKTLDNLSTEVLIKIFLNLNIKELATLRQTCKRFKEIVDQWGHLILNCIYATFGEHPKFLERCQSNVPSLERIRTRQNWEKGRYREKTILPTKIRYLPHLNLQTETLWLSKGSHLRGYNRINAGIETNRLAYSIKPKLCDDICRFSVKNDHILAGQDNGSLWLWSIQDQKFVFDQDGCHENNIDSCDFCHDILVSGSKSSFKVWKRPPGPSNSRLELLHEREMTDRLWSLALCDEKGALLALGTAGNTSLAVISIYDTNRNEFVSQHLTETPGGGVLEVQWETPQLLWSCGYDSYLRRWDLRTGSCVQEFMDPCNASVYCFQLDFGYSMVTGTATNGRAVLWDQRADDYLQLYFFEACKKRDRSSPIYSLGFDSQFLFAATDRNLNILDFSRRDAERRDYSGMLKYHMGRASS